MSFFQKSKIIRQEDKNLFFKMDGQNTNMNIGNNNNVSMASSASAASSSGSADLVNRANMDDENSLDKNDQQSMMSISMSKDNKTMGSIEMSDTEFSKDIEVNAAVEKVNAALARGEV